MKKRWSLILVFISIAVVLATAQTRTVTNGDLEKYRQKRLAAERDLRENYERLGFPSPEEMEKQAEKSRAEKSALAARLEAENIAREHLNLERQRAENEARIFNYQPLPESYQRSDNGNFYNYGLNGFYGIPNNRHRRFNRGGFSGGYYRNHGNQPRFEYRNNLPVRVQPAPQRIFAPRQTGGGRRN